MWEQRVIPPFMLCRLLRDHALRADARRYVPSRPAIEGDELDLACSCDDLDAFERAARLARSEHEFVSRLSSAQLSSAQLSSAQLSDAMRATAEDLDPIRQRTPARRP
jgi:hypothetical protein